MPLVRADIVRMVFEGLRRAGADVDAVLVRFGLDREDPGSGSEFADMKMIYEVLKDVQQASGDPHLFARAGNEMVECDLPLFGIPPSQVSTVSELLAHASNLIVANTNAARQTLVFEGTMVTLTVERLFNPSPGTGQSDAIWVAAWLRMLANIMKEAWNPSEVVVRMGNPLQLPRDLFPVKVLAGGPLGFSIRFPSSWLLYGLGSTAEQSDMRSSFEPRPQAPTDFVAGLLLILRPHVGREKLSASTIANLSGHPISTLKKELARQGTSISGVIRMLNEDYARRKLADTDTGITQIALELGYSDVTAFTRAFKRWCGTTPFLFRTAARRRRTSNSVESVA